MANLIINPFDILSLSVCYSFAVLGRKDSAKDNFDKIAEHIIGLSMANEETPPTSIACI